MDVASILVVIIIIGISMLSTVILELLICGLNWKILIADMILLIVLIKILKKKHEKFMRKEHEDKLLQLYELCKCDDSYEKIRSVIEKETILDKNFLKKILAEIQWEKEMYEVFTIISLVLELIFAVFVFSKEILLFWGIEMILLAIPFLYITFYEKPKMGYILWIAEDLQRDKKFLKQVKKQRNKTKRMN